MPQNQFTTHKIAILTKEGFLAENIGAYFTQMGTRVKLFADKNSRFKPNVARVFSKLKDLEKDDFDYIILFSALEGEEDFLSESLKVVSQYIQKRDTKVLAVLPNNVNSARSFGALQNFINSFPQNTKTKIIFAGDIIGAGIPINDALLTHKMISEAGRTKKLSLPQNLQHIHLITFADLTKGLSRFLFSYWTTKELHSYYSEVSVSEFASALSLSLPNLETEVKQFSDRYFLDSYIQTRKTKVNFDSNAIVVMLHEVLKNQPTPKPLQVASHPKPDTQKFLKRAEKIVKPKAHSKHKLKLPLKRVAFYFGITSFILLLPFLTVGLTGVLAYVGQRSLVDGNTTKASSSFTQMKQTATAAVDISHAYSYIPLLGNIYKKIGDEGLVLYRLSVMGKSASKAYEDIRWIIKGTLAKEEYDVKLISKDLALELDSMYNQSSFLESEEFANSFILKNFPNKEKFKKARGLALSMRELAMRLPSLVDAGRPSTYMVLLQNNMELRPTGGFIGSFGLFTFDKGKLIDYTVYDVYSADGQLKGHVEPPSAIKNYLGEANWYLRDSNWDPDFNVSATRAEWFLDKEMDRSVDGVVAIDLEVAKDLLEIVGPIQLDGFGYQIDSSNMYEKLQHEVEDNFFPGSQRKANILTSLSNELIKKSVLEAQKKAPQFAESIYSNLEERHIQIKLNDAQAQKVVNSLKWDGGAEPPNCGNGCLPLWVSMVEANVGVNKANYYLTRSSEVSVNIDNTFVNYTLKLKLVNESTANLKLGGRYKAYLRALAPTGSTFERVVINDFKSIKSVNPEIVGSGRHMEAGVLVEVPPTESREVTYKWSVPHKIDIARPGSAEFILRKQAGLGQDPVAVSINSKGLPIFTQDASLTRQNGISYNTTLENDIILKLNW